jgi:hypothetical protein
MKSRLRQKGEYYKDDIGFIIEILRLKRKKKYVPWREAVVEIVHPSPTKPIIQVRAILRHFRRFHKQIPTIKGMLLYG